MKSTNDQIKHSTANDGKLPVMQSLCRCINWHPPIKADQGKKAVCSYCKRPRHTIIDISHDAKPNHVFTTNWAIKHIVVCDETKIDKQHVIEKIKSLTRAVKINF